MAYEMVMPYHLHMPSYFLETFTEYPYLNDSLLLDQTMPDANLKVEIKRFAEDNVLMVVDNKTDKTTPFNLNPEGSRVEVKKSGDVIYILEREADSLLE